MSGLASDFASHFTKIGDFDEDLKMIYTEKRKMNLLIRALRNEAPDVENSGVVFSTWT